MPMKTCRFQAALAFFLLLICAACGDQSGKQAENIAVSYVKALFSRDTDQVMKLVYLPEQLNVLVSDKMIRDLLQAVLAQLPDEAGKDLKVDVVSSSVSDQKAEVRVRISTAGRTSEETIHLVNIDGWKVVPDL